MEITSVKTEINYDLLKDSKINFEKNSRKKTIFHYTSIGGLEGILFNKKLRFTNIRYMNDKDEIVAGLDSLAKACTASEEERESLISSFVNIGAQTFVCCFSLEGDSLPMWNYYTKEVNSQGYNIEFDDKLLVESILKNNPILDGCDFSFGIVDYSKDNDSEYSNIISNELLTSFGLSISKLFLTVVKTAQTRHSTAMDQSSLEQWENKITDTEKKRKMNDLPIYFYNGEKCSFERNPSGNYLYFVKRDCFKQEQECRIVITVPNELLPSLKKSKAYKFRISNGIMVPYLELNFSADVIKSITISPTIQSDLVEQSIEDFSTYCDLKVDDFSKFIKHSTVPVRF